MSDKSRLRQGSCLSNYFIEEKKNPNNVSAEKWKYLGHIDRRRKGRLRKRNRRKEAENRQRESERERGIKGTICAKRGAN